MEKVINGFPNYTITDDGHVYSLNYMNTGKKNKLKPRIDKYGYHTVHFRRDGMHINKSIHRLVAEHFIPNPENLPQVNHIDGDKANNNVSNLEWCTNSHNINHALNLKLINIEIPVIQLDINNNIVSKYRSISEASRITGINRRHINDCCKNNKYYKSAGGYKWKYDCYDT